MNVVELFAGAGGAALGLHAAGMSHLACVEYDKDAAATLGAAGFPAICGDVRDLSLYEGLAPDVVWSSFPCQCWSAAGNREGAADTERNGWPWTVSALDKMKPDYLIAENVVGLTQHRTQCERGCLGPDVCAAAYLDRVILAQLRERFAFVSARVLNASAYGVAQHRRRLIIVASPHEMDWPEPTHGEPTGQGDLFGRQLLPWRTVRDVLGCDFFSERNSGMRGHTSIDVDKPSNTILGSVAGAGGYRVIGGGTRGATGGMSTWQPRDCTDEPAPCVSAMQGATAGLYMVEGGSQPWRLDRPSPAVTAYREAKGASPGNHPEKLRGACDALFLATGRRRLTVQECAALQDFPVDHPWHGSQASQFRQVGNAVPPGLAQVVARAIIDTATTREGGRDDGNKRKNDAY